MSPKLKRKHKAAFIFGDKHELQRKGLVLDVGFLRPLLVWRSYWIDEGYVMSEWIKCSERMPDAGVMVLVYTPPQPGDYPEDVRIGFDFIDPEGDDPTFWCGHGENYEHFCCVAKGDDEMTGPSENAPYTHWMPLPEPPTD